MCLSSNGLAVPEHLDALADAGVTHMTITVNAVDPAIGAKIYSWVKDGKVAYRGEEAARLLLERQALAVAGLKQRGITVKLNSIVIPTINDQHMAEVARWGAELGADLMNLMPMYPTPNTIFEALGEPSRQVMQQLRADCADHMSQMTHCTRCRADAVGLLGRDRSKEMSGCLSLCSKLSAPKEVVRPYVAVASREGALVNLHLGQAAEFQIWGPIPGGFSLLEVRPAPEAGGGELRWKKLAESLSDCRSVLISGIRGNASGGADQLRRGALRGERLHRRGAQGHLRGRRPVRFPHPQGQGLPRRKDGPGRRHGLHVNTKATRGASS